MANLIIRTEDIKPEYILELYVETPQDRDIVKSLESPTPIILEGSRGTGKSFLLRVAEAQMLQSFDHDHILPVYVSFGRSSLLQSNDPNQFLHWMMARLCSRIIRTLYQKGILMRANAAMSLMSGGQAAIDLSELPLEKVTREYEDSYKNPGAAVDSSIIPTVEEFNDAIEDICRQLNIQRFAIFFDEAAHIFRPEQQRQFFTLFRDLRSPYLTCNAAVYPGVTFYGQTFQTTHDATIVSLNRDPLDPRYLDGMRDIVLKQADAQLSSDIARNRENFHALTFAVSGNPRLLLKTVGMASKIRSGDVKKVLKEFYRTTIWSEHSDLAGRYAGHRAFIDWGRDFIEKTVIPDTIKKNEQWEKEGKKESTCFFWIHRDAPTAIIEALRLLSYTGIVTQLDSGVIATRREIGTRYALNLGCLVASSAEPVPVLTNFGRTLSIKRFTEYGANHPVFGELTSVVGNFQEADISTILARELDKPIDVLDLTEYQKQGLRSINLNTVRAALQASETEFQRINYVGPKRSRKMMNIVTSSVLEYLSG